MELLRKKNQKFVRIVIGNAESKFAGVKAPTKTISVIGISVKDLYIKIKEMIEEDGKRIDKHKKV